MSVDGLIAKFGKPIEIYTRAESVDAGGAYTRVYTASTVLITVYLQPATPNESMVNGAIRASTSLTAYVNAIDGSSLATGQRLSTTRHRSCMRSQVSADPICAAVLT